MTKKSEIFLFMDFYYLLDILFHRYIDHGSLNFDPEVSILKPFAILVLPLFYLYSMGWVFIF